MKKPKKKSRAREHVVTYPKPEPVVVELVIDKSLFKDDVFDLLWKVIFAATICLLILAAWLG